MSAIIFQEAEGQLDKVGKSRQDLEITDSEMTVHAGLSIV